MRKELLKNIKTNMAQFTRLFDIETENKTITTQNNKIRVGLTGEWTLSGGIDNGTASAPCVNNTYTFENGEASTDCYFGDGEATQNIVASRLNVGEAISREVALEAITNAENNMIIVYEDTMKSQGGRYANSTAQDVSVKLIYTVGVMFRVDAEQMEQIGCTDMDIVFIGSVLGSSMCNTSLIKFDAVNARLKAGKAIIVDYSFSYEKTLEINDIIKSRLKSFDSTLHIK